MKPRPCSLNPSTLRSVALPQGSATKSARIGHFKPINSQALPKRLPRICFSFYEDQVASNSIGSRLAFHIRTKATSLAGRTRAEAIFVVAATRGLFPMKQFRAARKSDRIPRRFRSNWLNGASNLHGASRVANNARSISRYRKFSRGSSSLRREKIYRVRNRRDLSGGSETQAWKHCCESPLKLRLTSACSCRLADETWSYRNFPTGYCGFTTVIQDSSFLKRLLLVGQVDRHPHRHCNVRRGGSPGFSQFRLGLASLQVQRSRLMFL